MDETELMCRAIALAERAAGRTSPNPLVGCVLAKGGRIVGEGWHEGPGLPHAEVMALRAAGEAARGATAYVTLEPCDHTGRTGPCSLALIEAGVAEVVYAVADPNPLAAGGAMRLRAAGIPARQGPCEAQARALVRPWLHSLSSPLPYVTAKFAGTLDGRIATRTGESKWITGPAARARAHTLRQRSDAVIVGVGTVLADDPGLDPRPEGVDPAPCLKVVLDTPLRTPPTARLLKTPGAALIACGPEPDPSRRAALEAAGAEILPLPLEAGRPSLPALLKALRARDCLSVMVEGGAGVLGTFFDRGLVDEVWAFIAPVILTGGRPAIDGHGPSSMDDVLRLDAVETEALGPDVLIRGLVPKAQEVACSQAS
ncbi:diaminohydroxyphosphoribosylaminopyrimidine deaminase/5-amino-6-(5-phosphoribosylamino)uracil reductase [Parvularcula dongshanensis]|uniref:Riboflavin biosynthesis protein RibD n=1 Tax=Parvularcula dongshanensis TaxID=1173995 RepID=A0A840I7F7_9PROT|nr:bifunctional diaminohydroxyphosphoribosylaminopyrimidine deaminase/5-amino-6-(5-phosphoribosylamino)uracil reductase RibD [Parvularcula dongshanensis]MBB4660038.1 diaminohydroxyphosphoribosylaminopyrimidine deaminase/5-amino-6-(5-phosphoribosylamino)uracil reductase [Parvularcula dongshanensis]